MANQPPVKPVEVRRVGDTERASTDLVVVEEPLEIRLEHGPARNRQQVSVAVTMRTPGHDLELAAGFLLGEGILTDVADIRKIDWCANVRKPEEYGNVVKVELLPQARPALDKLARNFYMSSSCGVCGKASIEALEQAGCPVLADDGWRFTADWLLALPAAATAEQTVFRHTGGIHAASVFDGEGRLLVIREDVGRHNALDKAIGHLHMQGRLAQTRAVLVSGRAGFELVQKAAMAGIPLLAAVGAPSSLAVELAQGRGLSLAGFLRDQRFNLYAGDWRMEG